MLTVRLPVGNIWRVAGIEIFVRKFGEQGYDLKAAVVLTDRQKEGWNAIHS